MLFDNRQMPVLRSCLGKKIRRQFMSDFTVTDLAVTKLKEYMQANNIDSALRIALMQGG
jgi:hypothetical protein